jgi:hypothetical protein
MDDLLAAVGYVLLEWGYLERGMKRWLAPGESSASVFSRWKRELETVADAKREDLLAEIEELYLIRSLLAHGLSSASVHPRKEPHVSCRTREGAKRCLTLVELKETRKRLFDARVRVDTLKIRVHREAPS